MKKFDEIICKPFKDGITIDYGILNGSNKILFIKAGQNGSIYGYENKYLKIANNINEKYGYTVICSSNPFDGDNPLDNAMDVVKDYCEKNNYEEYEMYYMGHSNGGRIAACWGADYPQIKKFLLINSPIMINWHKTKQGLERMNKQKVWLIYGDKDPSSKYTDMFKRIENEEIHLVIKEGADHNFTHKWDEFIYLPEEYLTN